MLYSYDFKQVEVNEANLRWYAPLSVLSGMRSQKKSSLVKSLRKLHYTSQGVSGCVFFTTHILTASIYTKTYIANNSLVPITCCMRIRGIFIRAHLYSIYSDDVYVCLLARHVIIRLWQQIFLATRRCDYLLNPSKQQDGVLSENPQLFPTTQELIASLHVHAHPLTAQSLGNQGLWVSAKIFLCSLLFAAD